jgi:hypothetical protein
MGCARPDFPAPRVLDPSEAASAIGPMAGELDGQRLPAQLGGEGARAEVSTWSGVGGLPTGLTKACRHRTARDDERDLLDLAGQDPPHPGRHLRRGVGGGEEVQDGEEQQGHRLGQVQYGTQTGWLRFVGAARAAPLRYKICATRWPTPAGAGGAHSRGCGALAAGLIAADTDGTGWSGEHVAPRRRLVRHNSTDPHHLVLPLLRRRQ